MLLNLLRRWATNRQRAIFRYWDGSKMRSIDPMVAYRILDNDPVFDWESHPLLIEPEDPSHADDKQSVEAYGITASAVRSAFGIPEYKDGKGLTEGELVNLLGIFAEWSSGLKKSIRQTQTLPEPTEPEPSDESATNANSPCGSTLTE